MQTVAEIFRNTKKTLFSFELLPPLKGYTIQSVFSTIDKLVEFNPANINITYHQEEVVYKKLDNGLLQRRSVRKRPGTVAIAAAIKSKYPSVNVVPHLICGGFSKEETEYALIDLHFLNVHNILALRGDPPKSSRVFKPEENGHRYASELIKQIKDLNRGLYLDDDLENTAATNFSVGVAGYPEKHVEAANIESDIHFLKKKIDAGGEYIVTQMFFDNRKFFDFVGRCHKNDINVPIIPGLKPISRLSDIRLLPKTFNIDIPEEFAKELRKCKTNEEAYNLGIEWSIKQARELISHNVPSLHFFTIGIADNIKMILKEIF